MKAKFHQRLLNKITRLDAESVQSYFGQLARERKFLETVFNSLHDGIIVTDEDGRISYLNQTATDLIGLPQDNALGLPLGRYLPDLKLDSRKSGPQRAVSREIEVFYPRQRYLQIYAVPLVEAGTGAVMILRDATESRREAQEAIATERNEALRLLAAGVAHEIGNPLNSLHIHLQLLDRELRDLPDERRESLQESLSVARKEVARLDKIISQFLHALRPGKPRFERESINAVIEEISHLLASDIENRGIKAEINLSRGLPRVWLDRDQMKQVFINLIKNALEAMSRGGKLTLSTERTESHVVVGVADTGVGISPERIGRIFDPYQSSKESGSGLGLMVVRRIVQEHGGAIDVDSVVGKGTVFRVRLPISEQRARLLEAPANVPKQLSITTTEP